MWPDLNPFLQSCLARVSSPHWQVAARDEIPNGSYTRPMGALVYDTRNIGDEVQTLAALGCFPSDARPVPINRDGLDKSPPGSGPLTVAMNGWFTHRVERWPPHPRFRPVFVGFHLATKNLLSHPENVAYLQRHGPVGCRDTHTAELLAEHGIATWFSGCPTLTLRRPKVERSEEVLIVDAHLVSDDWHTTDTRELLLRTVPEDIRSRARFLTQNIHPTCSRLYGWKLRQARHRLVELARARLVITNRLHIALPCLAFGTPCVLLHENADADPRIRDYVACLHHASSKRPLRDFDWRNPRPREFPQEFAQLRTRYTSLLAAP